MSAYLNKAAEGVGCVFEKDRLSIWGIVFVSRKLILVLGMMLVTCASVHAGYAHPYTQVCYADFETALQAYCSYQNPDYSTPGYIYQRDKCTTTTVPSYVVNAHRTQISNGDTVNFNYSGSLASCNPQPQIVNVYSAPTPPSEDAPCPCFGNPIYPLTGSKKEFVETGFYVGTRSLRLTYDSARHLTASAAGILAKDFGDLPAFGALWLSSLHRKLIVTPAGTGAKIFRGDGNTRDFLFQNGAYVAAAGNADQLIPHSLGYRYVDSTNKSIETYSSSGQLTSLADVSGNVLTFIYSTAAGSGAPAAGYLTQVSDNKGYLISFEYTLPAGGNAATDGRISKITNSAAQIITPSYDSNGNLSALTWTDGKARLFLYENSALPWALTGVVDENSTRYATFGYDGAGRAVSTGHAGGVDQYSVSYGAPPLVAVTQVVDAPNQITYRYHEWQAPSDVAIVGPTGNAMSLRSTTLWGSPVMTGLHQPAGSGNVASSSAYVYDANANVLSKDDQKGQRICRVFDDKNRETVRVEGLSASIACSSVTPVGATLPAGTRKITTSWHPDWRLPIKLDQPLLRTTSIYHGQPDPWNSNITANCTAATNLPDGKPTPLLCKRVEQALLVNGNIDTTVAAKIRTYTYDAAGRMLASIDENSHTTSYSYYSNTVYSGISSPGTYDPDYEQVVLLLHGNGANGANIFVDSGPTPKTLSVVGAAQTSTVQSKFGGASMRFSGSGAYLTHANNVSFQFGSSDFTIEAWVYSTADTVAEVLALRNSVNPLYLLRRNVGGAMRWVHTDATGAVISDLTTTQKVALNTWTHIAVVRQAGTVKIYLDGSVATVTGTNSSASYPAPTGPFFVGAGDSASSYWSGYIDDLRITKGKARYTANFTPPTAEFLNNGPVPDPNDLGHKAGDLQSVTNAAGHVTQYTLYDRAGRVRQMIDPKGVVTDISYTPRGWVNAVTTTAPGGSGRATTYTYDGVGQLTGVVQPDGTTLSYSYDAAHRLVGVTDARGNSINYTLDNLGNRINEDVKDPTGVLQRSISRSFDALNRVQQVTGAAQ